MTSRSLGFVLRLSGGVIFLAAIAWPTVALCLRCSAGATPTIAEAAPSVRQWTLLGRTAAMAGTATVLTILVALPVAAAVVGMAGGRRTSAAIGALFVVLLTPPMVHCFGWDRLLPNAIDPSLRCIVVWSLWAFPIPSLILAAGWRRGGRSAFEAALLSVGPTKALIVGTVPTLQRHLLLSAAILFLLFFGDYGVPHASGLTVLSTELLGWASNSHEPLDAIVPALPGVALMVLGAGGAAWWARGWAQGEGEDFVPTRARMDWAGVLALGVVGVGWLLPLCGLLMRLGSPRALLEAAVIYKGDIAWSLFTSVIAGIASSVIAAAVMGRPRTGRLVGLWMLILGTLPGALIGVSLIAAYNRPATSAIADHWPILALCYVARFGWIAALAGMIAAHRQSDLQDQAALDGADAGAIAIELQLPMHAPVLAAAAAVITALSLAELPASSLVRVPTYNPVAHVVIEKFHRFEYAMLASLCFVLVLATLVSAALLVRSTQNNVR